jgi:hypothetical protein
VSDFALVTVEGEALGPIRLDGPDSRPGSLIYTGPHEPNLRVVDVMATENDDPEKHFKVLVVEEV